MNATAELRNILHCFLDTNKSVVKFIVEFILALIKVRTVNLVEISQAFSGKALLSSKYRKIQRFFQNKKFSQALISQVIAAFYPSPKEGWILSMDRTNWDFGVFKINILMISISKDGLAIPLIWQMLEKKGNSNTEERINLMKNFLKIFNLKQISSLIADREFIGEKWIKWLNENKIPFTIRIKHNIQLSNSKGKIVKAKDLFSAKKRTSQFLKEPYTIQDSEIMLSGLKLHTEEWLIVITNHDYKNSLSRYKLRWSIEVLFAALKTRGFNFESTHLSNIEKIDTLLSLLSIAYIWSYKIGEIKAQSYPIAVKSHGRRALSIFRVGLDAIREALLNITNFIDELNDFILVFWGIIKKMTRISS